MTRDRAQASGRLLPMGNKAVVDRLADATGGKLAAKPQPAAETAA